MNANLTETGIPGLNDIFKGKYTDFHAQWYIEVGQILTKAMAINAVMPVVEFFINYAMREGFRRLDRGFGSDTLKSKKRSI